MPSFDDFDLSSALDKEAFSILDQGNSDLIFGGSSEAEAQVFGQQINSNDGLKVGAFLGGVALANLKVQNQRTERFNRIRSLQEEIKDRKKLELEGATLGERIRSNRAQEGISSRRLDQDQDQFNVTSQQNDRRLDISETNSNFDRAFAQTKFASQERQLKVENNIANAQLQIKRGNAQRAQLDSDSLKFVQTYLVEVGGVDASTVLNASPEKALQAYTSMVKERNSTPLNKSKTTPSRDFVDPNDVSSGGF